MVTAARRVPQAARALLESQASQGHRASQAHLDPMDSRGLMEPPARLDQEARKESLVSRDRVDSQDVVYLDLLGRLGPQDSPESWVV